MAYELSVKNERGNLLNLTSSEKYTIYKIEGLNPPKATINQSVNTTQDGSAINSTRVENRNIVIYMTIEGDIEINRIALYSYFTPKRTVRLYFKNGSRDVYIDGVVESVECDLFAQKEEAQISIICPKPYFKDVNQFITSFSDVDKRFSFPFNIEKAGIEFSVISTNVRKSILYSGDVATGLIINLFAVDEVVNPVLYDVLKGTYMKFNLTMKALDTLVVNTNIGEKSIALLRNAVESNAMGYLSPDSDWFTLDSGDNVYTYGADSGTSNLQITFNTSLSYGGV